MVAFIVYTTSILAVFFLVWVMVAYWSDRRKMTKAERKAEDRQLDADMSEY